MEEAPVAQIDQEVSAAILGSAHRELPAAGYLLPPWLQVNDLEMLDPIRQLYQRRPVFRIVFGMIRIAAAIARNRSHRIPERHEHEFHGLSAGSPEEHPAAIAVDAAVVRVGAFPQELRIDVGLGQGGPAAPDSDYHEPAPSVP